MIQTIAPDSLLQAALRSLPFELTRHEISIPHLPDAFHGFTVVQLSDLHIDRWNTELLEAAIPWVNDLKADLVLCTGDTIANGKAYLGTLTALMKQLKAKHGKFACLGNHDYSDGEHGVAVSRALEKAAFEVLVNRNLPVWVKQQKIQLAGVDDFIKGKQCLQSTTKRLDSEIPTILLSHNPENFGQIARFKPTLVLSGHTHGGQIRMPEWVHQRMLGTPYIAGHYRQPGSQLYVNRGLGSAVFIQHLWQYRLSLPTPRLFIRPEVSVFTLLNPRLATASTPQETTSQSLAG